MSTLQDVIVVGGGPAGLMSALLFARKGLAVTLLEMHDDFDRDFRGDTVHASTMQVLDQIGLADDVLQLPHYKLSRFTVHTPTGALTPANFERLPTRFNYVTIMRQALFLQFLCGQASQHPGFTCVTGAAVQQLQRSPDNRINGVVYRHHGDTLNLNGRLVIAADGRFSRLRKLAGLSASSTTPPMDVAWCRVSRRDEDGNPGGGLYVAGGYIGVLLPRDNSWQVGLVFAKGTYSQLRASGIQSLQQTLARCIPWLADRTGELADWQQIHVLNVQSDCLQRWHTPGLQLIGDAAHVMSPVGGVGINAAISDAVTLVNLMLPLLLQTTTTAANIDAALPQVFARRIKPTRQIQKLQGFIQNRLIGEVLADQPFSLPWPARLLLAIPGLRDLPARSIALGPSPVMLQQP